LGALVNLFRSGKYRPLGNENQQLGQLPALVLNDRFVADLCRYGGLWKTRVQNPGCRLSHLRLYKRSNLASLRTINSRADDELERHRHRDDPDIQIRMD